MKKYGSNYFNIDPISNREQADIRNWSSLPGKISYLRTQLPEGRHAIATKYYSYYGEEIFEGMISDIDIKGGKRLFLYYKLP